MKTIWKTLKLETPAFCEAIDAFVRERLPEKPIKYERAKSLHDPVWGTIRLRSEELSLIDTALFQRLRRLRQLTFADRVYPGAVHTRFEHSIGCVHTMQSLIDAIRRQKPEALGRPEDQIDQRMRIAALVHDIGQCALGEAGVALIREEFIDERHTLGSLAKYMAEHIQKEPSVGALLSAAIVASSSFAAFLTRMNLPEDWSDWIATLLMGGHRRRKLHGITSELELQIERRNDVCHQAARRPPPALPRAPPPPGTAGAAAWR